LSFGNTPVKMVVGASPGGGVDVVARIVCAALGEKLQTPVVVDNKPGFSGNLGAQFVAKAPPDGLTLLMAPVTSFALIEGIMGKASGYSLEQDLVAVAPVAEVPFVLVVNPSLPANTLQEFIALAKRHPNGISVASAGNGSTEHVSALMFQQQTGAALLHVPYKGGAPAITDLISGQVGAMFATIPNVIGTVASGRLKALAIMTRDRHPSLPQIPTAMEAGVSLDITSLYVVMAPAATPSSILRRLNGELAAVVKQPETVQKIEAIGVKPVAGATLAEAKIRTQAVIARWKAVVKSANIKLE
jgi:tripartite-type tricarboxylate transporter receptor subunit TctC